MLLDTSGLLALLDAREPRHNIAIDEYKRATVRVTHSFVLSELVALGNARGIPDGKTLQFVMSLIANPDIDTIWPDEARTSQGITLLLARKGKRYSLCDALSFVIMRARALQDALSTDQHFENEGFRRLLI